MTPSVRRQAHHILAALVLVCAAPFFPAGAQCRPAKDSHEARLLAFYSAPIAFSIDPAAAALPLGGIRIGAEVVPIPRPSATLQQTGNCFQNKSENTHLAPVFGRPRLAVGLGRGFALEASYFPPITIADATPNLGSLALSRFSSVGPVALVARLHATVGKVTGPITCPKSALQSDDPSDPCYGSTPSKDTFKPTMQGGELMVLTPRGARRWTLFGGAGVNALQPRFRVGFTDGLGGVDHTRIEVNLTRVTLAAGGAYAVTSRCDLGGQLYSVPSDLTTVRVMAGCRLR